MPCFSLFILGLFGWLCRFEELVYCFIKRSVELERLFVCANWLCLVLVDLLLQFLGLFFRCLSLRHILIISKKLSS